MPCRLFSFVFFVLCGFISSFAGEVERTPRYVCQRVAEPPVVDGRLDEGMWQKALVLSPFRDIEGERGEAQGRETMVRMLWDEEFLYIGAQMKEPHVWATQKERDSVVFQDPDFEVFLDPDGTGGRYMEIEINALNTVWDLYLTRPYRHQRNEALHDWDIKKLKHAVHVDGSLNNPADEDRGWSVEMAIPWESITGNSQMPRAGKAPEPGEKMRMNFSRVNWRTEADEKSPCGYGKVMDGRTGKPLPESNHVWAPTGVVNIHLPEFWGEVCFSASAPGTWESFPADRDEPLRLELFRLYRQQGEFRKENGRYASGLDELVQRGGKKFSREISYVSSGGRHWIAECRSPYTGRILSMTEEGILSLAEGTGKELPRVCLWAHGNDRREDAALWKKRFADYARAGVDTVIMDGGPEALGVLAPLAREVGLDVIAWIWALNQPGNSEALAHPDWYAVSRDGKSCHKEGARPFVDYYQFLCPNHPEVGKYLETVVKRHAAIPGVSALQLDYIRLPDVILPKGLWKKYDLIMDRELAFCDFCYCSRCRAKFEEKYGRPVSESPENDAEWRQFRLDSVAEAASRMADEARRCHLPCGAAVFPTPSMASRLVRQNWGAFRLDFALPMDYNSFYDEPDAWVGQVTRQATEETGNRFPLYPGIHLPDVTPESLPVLLDDIMKNGGRGAGLFSHDTFSPELQEALRLWIEKNRSEQTVVP